MAGKQWDRGGALRGDKPGRALPTWKPQKSPGSRAGECRHIMAGDGRCCWCGMLLDGALWKAKGKTNG